MKKTTLLWCFLCCFISTALFAQTPAELTEIRAAQAAQTETIDIQNLVDRYEAIGNTFAPLTDYFTKVELGLLRSHFRSQQANRMADIIPTAGATETFAVVAGDFFYDPSDGTTGGPGGDCSTTSSGDPGDYPNCGCVTVTTLTGTDLSVEFLSFNVFGTFDFLNIYDGPDTASPQIYDSNLNTDTDTLAGMIAANGSAVFTSTSGALTFEFSSTTVVNSCGWEVEVLDTGGGGGGGPATVYGFEAFDLNMYGSFDPTAPEVFTSISMGANDGNLELSGDVDPFDMGTAYASTVTPAFYSLDIATGAYTLIGPGDVYIGMSFHPVTGELYAVDTNGDLVTIDKTTGASTVIGAIDAALALADMAIDGAGNAYGHDIAGDQIVSIDLTSGATTAIGPTGFDANFAQGMTWDANSDTVFLAAFNFVTFLAEWRSVDLATGATTIVGIINDPASSEVTWAGIPDVTPPPVTNDECDDAFALACGDVVMGETDSDTDSGGNPAPDEFYTYTGSGSPEFITLSTCNNGDFDTVIRVFEDCTLANELFVNDDAAGCSGFTSELNFLSDGTSTYYIMVEGFSSASGNFTLSITCNPVADNDLCTDATPIACGDAIAGSTNFATIDDDVAGTCDETYNPNPFLPIVEVTAPGVWYTYTESNPGLIQDIVLSVCDTADFDSKISVYTGDCGALTCVAANDDDQDCTAGLTSTVSFQSDGSSTYYILVHGFGTATGDFTLSMDCTPVPPPNDMIANSIDVDEIGFPYTDPAVNMPGATTEAGSPDGCSNAGVQGVWYHFTPEGDGAATANITNPGGFSSVTFYTAPSEDAVETDLVLVDYFQNQCVPGTEATILTTAGQTYYVYVANTGTVTDIVIDGLNLGIGDAIIDGFSYYPNPADDVLHLNAGTKKIDSAIVYNILGQAVVQSKVGENSSTLDVSALSVGTYVLKVVVEGEVGIYKIVKE